MANEDETLEEEYDEYEEYDEDEEDEEGGLSGFSVLVIGLVMFGAFAAITWIAYQQGIKRGENTRVAQTPYVAADPEPMKIRNANNEAPSIDREVYDVFDSNDDEPVTVLAEGPEEPIARSSEDPIGALAANLGDETFSSVEDTIVETAQEVQGEVNDRIADLREEDATVFQTPTPVEEPVAPATEPTPVNAPITPAAASNALAGSHVVQVGAFRSEADAQAQWARMQAKLGSFADGKTIDIQRADLGDRGIYHRLRIGPFSSSDDAKTYCSGLKERGQDCLIKGI